MTSYLYRPERADLRFHVTFFSEETHRAGHCLNMSESGLLARFEEPLELWVVGELLLRTARQQVRIPARVARVNGREAGLSFVFKNDKDREAIGNLLSSERARTPFQGSRPPF